jgi:peptidyl-prolyl cis-trans isomerase B (cyclophilin B)
MEPTVSRVLACAPVRNALALFLCGTVCGIALALGACRAESTSAPGEIAVVRVRGMGEIRFRLLPGKAPRTVANFKQLAAAGFYDGTTFHRVIPSFMIQGGDPNSKDADPANDGFGTPGYFIAAEFNDLPHRPGTVSMARQAAPDSAGSQFFIMTTGSESWRPQLDGQYTAFGELISGQDLVDRISRVPRSAKDRPLENVVLESVRIEPG